MKVTLINTFERTGGAAIAARRLFHALSDKGVTTQMIVRDGKSNNAVHILNSSTWQKRINFLRFVWERIVIFLFNHCSRKNLFAVSIANSGTDISKMDFIKETDIIHIHWINQGMLSLKYIEQLGKLGKPIVWTMHDMWPCTGICHHARECNQYKDHCHACPFVTSPSLASSVFKKKKRIWEKLPITFVTCSEWLRERTSHSKLMVGKKLLTIPNPIDTSLYRPKDKDTARKRLGLPTNKTLVLFGAVNAADKRKGIDYMVEAMDLLTQNYPQWKDQLEVVIAGNSKSDLKSLFTLPIHSISYITNDEEMIDLYNAVDLYVTSSLEENLPNMIMEAMACGTPCVGFKIGGIPEMIDSTNGYIAEYKSSEDLCKGINTILSSPHYENYAQSARSKVVNTYAYETIASQYIELYNQLLHE